jgi:hypothetical protein
MRASNGFCSKRALAMMHQSRSDPDDMRVYRGVMRSPRSMMIISKTERRASIP